MKLYITVIHVYKKIVKSLWQKPNSVLRTLHLIKTSITTVWLTDIIIFLHFVSHENLWTLFLSCWDSIYFFCQYERFTCHRYANYKKLQLLTTRLRSKWFYRVFPSICIPPLFRLIEVENYTIEFRLICECASFSLFSMHVGLLDFKCKILKSLIELT